MPPTLTLFPGWSVWYVTDLLVEHSTELNFIRDMNQTWCSSDRVGNGEDAVALRVRWLRHDRTVPVVNLFRRMG